MDNLKKILNAMPPEQALELLSQEVRLLLAHMDDDSRTRFLVKMIGDAGVDRVAGLVDL